MNDLVPASQDDAPPHLARLRGGFRAVLRHALDAALPPLCPPAASRSATAPACARPAGRSSPFIEPPYCARLGIPFSYDPGPGLLSMEAIAAPPAYNRARAAVRYDDTARALVLSFKYGDRLDLAPMLGQWMARAGRELLKDADALGRCRCIGAGCGRAASTSRRRWPAASRRRLACRYCPIL